MSRYLFVQVGKDEKFKMTLDQLSFENTVVHQVPNNKKPLATVYNESLHIARTEKEFDFVVFMHADVAFDVQHLIKHIEECKDKYDVMGLCGTSIANVSQCPLNWWTASNPTPKSKWGCVTHGELGDKKSFFNSHSPDITDHEVACIDGLCIIFGPKALRSELKFDEIFHWDFYDTDISFQTILKFNLKLGVIVEQSLHHYSVGKSILTKDFLMHELDFRKKWNLEIPKNSPLQQLLIQAAQPN